MAKPKVTHYNKLVRDGIPRKIRENGDTCEYRLLEPRERVHALMSKLVEEVTEAVSAQGHMARLKEIVDILEVIDGLLAAYNLGRKEIREIQLIKRKHLGGFKRGVFLISTQKGTKAIKRGRR